MGLSLSDISVFENNCIHNLFTHIFTHLLTYFPANLLTQFLTYSLTHRDLFIYSLTDSLTHLHTTYLLEPFSLCFDHGVIDDPTRSVKFITKDSPTSDYGALSDSTWYRFTGDPGTQLATTCVPEGRCGTQATGWLNSPYPSQETGIAKADVCFNFGGDCCAHKETIYLRKCSNFYVFKFEKVKIAVTPKRRYCVETHTGK